MNIKSTFIHLPNFGKKTEKELWEKGILSWEKYIQIEKESSLFFEESSSVLNESQKAYANKNIDFFSKTLAKQEYYRLALSFPEEVLFLDIETTGLSSYYDYITMVGWSKKDKYGYYIYGLNDISELKETINNSKIIVTFNGSIFDIPFLKAHFKDLKFPKAHIDLRFLSKSNGLEGGQKNIEEQIGFKRTKSLVQTNGFMATLLWDEYKWGRKTSLEKLIAYNHSDIEGMKEILDYCINNIYKKNKYYSYFDKPFEFKKYKSILDKKGLKEFIKKHDIPFDKKSTLKFKELFNKINRNIKIVGIDLTGSETKASGVAFLNNDKVKTYLMATDDEMIEEIIKFKPHIVSIDSPLSLPKGRLTVFDDDPTREDFGILRICERILKKRGVNAYPTLLPSMQKLTKRGIELAKRLRKKGIPVIESYPGVVQDIIGLPRKQASLDLLKKGLGIFGLKGEFLKSEVSHDEIDAITSAIVGVFFLSGDYEAIGSLDENLMIIPNLNAKKEKKHIIGVAGEIASGKTTFSKILKIKDFAYARYSEILEDILKENHIEITRENLQDLGQEISEDQYKFSLMLYEKIKDKNRVIIDGLRHLEDYTFFFEMFGLDFSMIFIETELKIREQRYIEKYKTNNYKDIIKSSVEKNIKYLKSKAKKTIDNNTSLDSLHNQVEEI